MYCRIIRFAVGLGIAWVLAVGWWAGVARGAAKPMEFPSFGKVREVALRHFSLLPDYRPGDIIVRSEVEPLFAQLQRVGWAVSDRRDVLGKVPSDSDYLPRKLRTERGRKFMRRIANHPNAYDRLERLSRLPYGKQTVHDLIYKTGGHEMIEYLTTASGGKELGKMLSKAPKGARFNEPTGRIYTVKMFLVQLQKSHATEAARREKAARQ